MNNRIPPHLRERPFFARPVAPGPPAVAPIRWADAVLCSLDCETTGVETRTDRVWEWGAYWWGGAYHGKGESRLCNPEQDLPEKLAKKLGVTPELWAQVRESRLFSEQVPEFEATMETVRRLEAVIVGWSVAAFDLEILRSELHRARRACLAWELWKADHKPTASIDGLPVIDGLALASWWRPDLPSLNLGKVAASLGHAVPEGLHRTGVDAPLALHLTRALVNSKMPGATLAAVVRASDEAVRVRAEDRRVFAGRFSRAHDGTLWCRWGQAGKRIENVTSPFLMMLLRDRDIPEAGKRRLRQELEGRGE